MRLDQPGGGNECSWTINARLPAVRAGPDSCPFRTDCRELEAVLTISATFGEKSNFHSTDGALFFYSGDWIAETSIGALLAKRCSIRPNPTSFDVSLLRDIDGVASNRSEPLRRKQSKDQGPQAAKSRPEASSTAASPAAQDLLYGEDLQVGDCWTTEPREISADDVVQFAGLTGDHTSIHDPESSDSPFGRPIVHGLLGLSVLAGLGSTCPNVATLAFVGIGKWSFDAPLFHGEKVHAHCQVISLESHGRRAVKVLWLRQLINESGTVVQQGEFETLVAMRHRRSGKSPNKPR